MNLRGLAGRSLYSRVREREGYGGISGSRKRQYLNGSLTVITNDDVIFKWDLISYFIGQRGMSILSAWPCLNIMTSAMRKSSLFNTNTGVAFPLEDCI